MLLKLDREEAAYIRWRLLVSDRDNPTAIRIMEEIEGHYPDAQPKREDVGLPTLGDLIELSAYQELNG